MTNTCANTTHTSTPSDQGGRGPRLTDCATSRIHSDSEKYFPLASYLCAIDVETGDLDPNTGALLSIAAVGEDGSRFLRWIKPSTWWHLFTPRAVTYGAVKVNGYSSELWQQKGAVSLKQAAIEFRDWISSQKKEGRRVEAVAHNAGFDRAWLEKWQDLTGIHFGISRRWRCSQSLLLSCMDAGLIHPGASSLDALCSVVGVVRPLRDGRHDAALDAAACLQGYQFLLNLMKKERDA